MVSAGANNQVRRVLATLDVSAAAVDYAVNNGFDTIISHHPLIFKPLTRIGDSKLFRLIQNEINVFSFHTRLDIVSGGVNDILAANIGLENVEVYGGEGVVRVGELPRAYGFHEYIAHVKRVLDCPAVTAVRQSDTVKRVAVCGGDGKDFFNDAVSSGADTYVVGNLSYNAMVDAAESGMNVIEAGHFQTENAVTWYLKQLTESLDTEILCEVFGSNPILYL
jgi:dinuclear metal center YbgI/SA1388 family protein